jgi:hypothetical protein
VLSESANIRVTVNGEVDEFRNELAAYEAEWEEIIAVVSGAKKPRYSMARVSDDLRFSLSMIEQLPGLVNEDV